MCFLVIVINSSGAGISQYSDWAAGCTTEETGIDSQAQARDFSLRQSFQAGFRTHPTSYTVGY